MMGNLPLPELHATALRIIIRHIPPEEVTWLLTGSCSLRLQGVDVPVHDLDVQSDPAGVDEIAHRLAECVRQAPSWKESPAMRSYYAILEVGGVTVELMGDIQHRLADGVWSPAEDLEICRRWLDWEGLRVPVFDLANEAQAYEELGRAEKARLIQAALARRR